jgi:uncharacterized protein (TIGR03663 family)
MSRVNLELLAYVAIVALSVLAHLWGLGNMALHHDESIHAWSSWRFYTGAGSFTCWGGQIAPTYCYDPVYHGPSLYFFTALAYFLFGDGDWQARLPMAVSGILMVASCWWLRPYLGRRGALIAAVLVGFSPSLLYYTRFARHDGLMVLFEVWMFIGVFRWLDSGRPFWLYLTAAAIALAVATHELYYILFFIFGIFVLMRLIAESRYARYLNMGLLVVLGLCLAFMVINPPIPIGQGLYFGEKAFLVASALLLAWLCQRLWDPRPILTERLKWLWYEDRTTLWVAAAILVGIYTVMYTTFFAYPRGFIDGLYAGLAYWLGSQQEYARGDQPWYYYLMLLPLYEPLAVACGIGVVAYLVTLVVRQILSQRRQQQAVREQQEAIGKAEAEELQADVNDSPNGGTAGSGKTILVEPDNRGASPDFQPSAFSLQPSLERPIHLVPLLLIFWFITAIIIFSWAGEKMPWLLTHMALPGNLLAAWVLGRLLRVVDKGTQLTTDESEQDNRQSSIVTPPALPALPFDRLTNREAEGSLSKGHSSLWLVPLLVLLALVAFSVAAWRMGSGGEGQAGQTAFLQGLVPLLLGGALVYALLTLTTRIGARVVLSLTAITLAVVTGAYMVRATWMVVYQHPDVPIEPLIYTQTSPDVPRYVQDVRELAINLTRNRRTSEDTTGGLSMPIILDSGDPATGGDGSLAWPMQWYLRDFQRITWKGADQYRNATPETFNVTLPDGSTGPAPVVMLAKPAVTEATRDVLRQNYVQPYGEGGVFNWWFPEGDKCAPNNPGYKRFYYSTWTPVYQLTEPAAGGGAGGCGRDISAEVHGPYAALLWPFQAENWDTLKNYVLYRELPAPLVPGARTMEVWVRKDLAAGVGSELVPTTAVGNAATLRLVAQQVIGAPGELANPTGVVVAGDGTVYVADTGNHRVQVFNPQGQLVRTIGGPTPGSGRNQFFEPRGLAVDAQNNLYVADTWNARIVKFSPAGEWLASWGQGAQDLGEGRRATITEGTQAGNAANPLGFFGPRGLAVDAQGNVYIADTGNKRIVVTDGEGNFRYQFGFGGAEPGQFNEPTGVAVDSQGNIYVSDTWNGRVQVFQGQQGSGQIAALPTITWRVGGWQPNTYDDPSLTSSPAGQVYVSVPSRQMVMAANLRGDVALRWGGSGDDDASLNTPTGMAVGPDGAVWVVDRDRNRVLRFVLPDVRP